MVGVKERPICEWSHGALAQGTALVNPTLAQCLGWSVGLLPLVLWQQMLGNVVVKSWPADHP